MDLKVSIANENGIAKITLAGTLDAANAPGFQEELKKLIGQNIQKLVFFAKDLAYISSAGLRIIIFAKQKIGVEAQLYLIGGQEAVLNVIKMSGLDNFMTIQDDYTE